MSRGRRGSGRGRGSRRGRISGRGRYSHTGIVQHNTSSKEKENPVLSKSLGNSMFIYGEMNSAGKMQTTWYKVVQHIGIAFGQDKYRIANKYTNGDTIAKPQSRYT